MSAKQITITIPDKMLKEIDKAARREHRSRAEFLREAARRSLVQQSARAIPVFEPTAEEKKLLRKAWKEFERGQYMPYEKLRRELGIDSH